MIPSQEPRGTIEHWTGPGGHWFLVRRDDVLYLTLEAGGVHYIQSAAKVVQPEEPVLPYIAGYLEITRRAKPRHILVAGVGLASALRCVASLPSSKLVCGVDLDLSPTRIATNHLPALAPQIELVESDLHRYLGTTARGAYDQIFLDVYSGDGWALARIGDDFGAQLRAALAEEGQLVINVSTEFVADLEFRGVLAKAGLTHVRDVEADGNLLVIYTRAESEPEYEAHTPSQE